MNNKQRHCGFSLTEVLLSVGILSVGMMFIAGVFPVAIHFTTIATERTVAAIAADEAFAKIKLYATGDPSKPINLAALSVGELRPDGTTDFDKIFPAAKDIDPNEFAYPSTDTGDSAKQYCWSALFRRIDLIERLVQVTIFISRKVSPNLKYHEPNGGENGVRPMPVKVDVSGFSGNNELTITGNKTFINDGYTIVDDATGRIYRVLERYAAPNDNKVLLDRNWDGSSLGGSPDKVWVVPPPVGGGRYPCIAVYQKVIRF